LFGVKLAVDVRKRGEVFGKAGLAAVKGRVQNTEEAAQLRAQVRAVGAGVVPDEIEKGLGFEDAAVFREEAEEYADHESLEVVAVIAGFGEAVMEVGKEHGGLEVGRVFGIQAAGFVAGDEGEGTDVIGEIGEVEVDALGL